MEKIRIIHCADIHLGAKFSATPEIASIRMEEHFLTFKKIIETARSEADILLIAGDLFDRPDVDSDIANRTARLLESAAIPVFITPGNHDPASPDSVYFNTVFPNNVHIFKENTLYYIELPYLGVRIWGAGFISPVQRENMIGTKSIEKDMKNILVIHGDLNADTSSPYHPIDEKELLKAGFDYIALGHVHSFYKNKSLAYSGCCEGTGFDECGEKGIIKAVLTEDGFSCNFIPVCKRQYICADFNGSSLSDDSLKDAFGENYKENIYKINLTDYDDPLKIMEFLKKNLFYVTVTDGKYTLPDYNELAKEKNLRGEFVRRMIEKIKNEPDNVKINTKALNYGIEAFDREVEIK